MLMLTLTGYESNVLAAIMMSIANYSKMIDTRHTLLLLKTKLLNNKSE